MIERLQDSMRSSKMKHGQVEMRALKRELPRVETRSLDSPVTSRSARHPTLALQRTVGNQATRALWSLGVIQAKLRVSRPDDRYEREAARIAAQVMRSSTNSAHEMKKACGGCSTAAPCSKCAEDGLVQRQRALGRGERGTNTAVPNGFVSKLGATQALHASTRSFFEPRFGRDFSDVRIHTDARADHAARSIDALAFTVGRNIVFRAGEYAPGTTAGRQLLAHELTHVVQQGGAAPAAGPNIVRERVSRGTVQLRVAPFNYQRTSDELHDAMAGWGTDEEAVYAALNRLERDQAAIDAVSAIYLHDHGETLEHAIRDDFSGSELEYALQLINRGRASSQQHVGAVPANPAQWEAAARRLRRAMAGWGTDEEAIFAVLLPLERNPTRISQLATAYQRLYRRNMRRDIVSELSGSELAYANQLLGGTPVVARTEVRTLDQTEARRLFDDLAVLSFWNDRGQDTRIPFHYPPDGCYARAQMMVQRMITLGYGSRAIFAAAGHPSRLSVSSERAADQPTSSPNVTWAWHIAPIVRVRLAVGRTVLWVMDPSLARRPLTVSDWNRQMSPLSFAMVPFQDLRTHMTHSGFVNAITSRHAMYPGVPFTAEEAARNLDVIRPRISLYARYASSHDLAAAIRPLLRASPIDVAAIVRVINAATPDARLLFRTGTASSGGFPWLISTLRARLSATDWARVRAALYS
jgi:hypothetical protein